jgi:hypothetical protein
MLPAMLPKNPEAAEIGIHIFGQNHRLWDFASALNIPITVKMVIKLKEGTNSIVRKTVVVLAFKLSI